MKRNRYTSKIKRFWLWTWVYYCHWKRHSGSLLWPTSAFLSLWYSYYCTSTNDRTRETTATPDQGENIDRLS